MTPSLAGEPAEGCSSTDKSSFSGQDQRSCITMGFFDRLLQRFQAFRAEDEFFGELCYQKAAPGHASYWEASRIFTPTQQEVELFIDAPAPEQLPSQLQREFFLSVEEMYAHLWPHLESLLSQEFGRWCGAVAESFREPAVPVARDEFTLKSISIPNAKVDEAEWELSFDSKTDRDHSFTIVFSSGRVLDVRIDG